jgi:hypothetical protein
MFVTRYCGINCVRWECVNTCLWCLFYIDSISQERKLDLRTEPVRLNCLSPLSRVCQCDNYGSCVPVPWRCTVQCHLQAQRDTHRMLAILMRCCIWQLPYWQHVTVQLSLRTASRSTGRAVTAGSSCILALDLMDWCPANVGAMQLVLLYLSISCVRH